MDFLISFGKKLKEFEEQARLLAEAQRLEAAEEPSDRPGSAPKEQRRAHKKKARQSQQPGGRRQLTSAERFGSDPCPTDLPPALPSSSTRTAGLGLRLVDDLNGRLDEAFLLSEVLGPPHCLKGWDDL